MVMPSPSSNAAPPAVGMVLAGRYRLDRALGAGGMAEVFEALDLTTASRVAVKVLRPHLTESAEAVQRFRREGQVLTALNNPAVVGIEAVQELEDGRVFIVMELLEGETLGARMKRGALSAQALAPIVAGCAAGLSAAHANGVVHRDLKPDNIFLARLPGGDEQLKLLDFGVSKVRGEEKLTQTGQVLGTPRYMSPEQLGAEPDIDPRVDVYALGVILYEALSGGKSPFLATTPTDLIVAILNGKVVPLRSVKSDVPAALEAVVMRAMAKVRAARYATAAELAEAFFDAGEIRAKAPPKPLGTSALGSMRTIALGGPIHPLPSSPRPSNELTEGGGLKQGTFSELSAFEVPKPERGTLEPQPSSVAGPLVARMSSPPTERAIPPTALSPAIVLSPVPIGPTEPATRAQLGESSASPRSSQRDPTGGRLSTSPTRGPADELPISRWPSGVVLIVVGLLAGGLAAGAVIAALTWLQQASGSMPALPPPPPPASVAEADAGPDASAPETGVGAAAERGASSAPGGGTETRVAEAAEAPVVEEPTTTGPARPTETGGTERTPAHSGHRTPAGHPTTEPAPGDVDPVVAATRALARGDAAECVDILDDVIASGGSPIALRRRADCLARMGDMREAIRDYQRFCRLVPDHPGIVEVREILEGLGQTCP